MSMLLRLSAVVFCGGAVAVISGCSRSEKPAAVKVQESEKKLGDDLKSDAGVSEESRQRMLAAKDALFQKLSGRLMEVMGQQGPAAAIGVCQKEAVAIASEIGRQHDLQLGRTGVRLRNAGNVAPAWAEPLIKNKTDSPTFLLLENGTSAGLLPIKMQAQCLMCHGPEEQIAPVISDELAKLYPNDEATGFKEGELRGWFWIEI